MRALAPDEDAVRTVRPGLHFLNAHRGKGQQFDWVIVLGMEEGFIPSWQAQPDEMDEEFGTVALAEDGAASATARRGMNDLSGAV